MKLPIHLQQFHYPNKHSATRRNVFCFFTGSCKSLNFNTGGGVIHSISKSVGDTSKSASLNIIYSESSFISIIALNFISSKPTVRRLPVLFMLFALKRFFIKMRKFDFVVIRSLLGYRKQRYRLIGLQTLFTGGKKTRLSAIHFSLTVSLKLLFFIIMLFITDIPPLLSIFKYYNN